MVVKEKNNLVKRNILERVDASKYLVLDMEEIPYSIEIDRFGWAIELLKIKRYCIGLNRFFKENGSNKVLAFDILDECTDCLFKNVVPDRLLSIKYYEFRTEVHTLFEDSYYIFKKSISVPWELDLYLLGLGIDTEYEDIPEKLQWEFDSLQYDYTKGALDFAGLYCKVKDAIKKLKDGDI
ncbi:MAG: hypothetical protein WBB27_13020 [Maribacter sp.]